MKKKYLYNGQLFDYSTIESSAKESKMDVSSYLSKAGIKEVDDTYDYDGKQYSADQILQSAKESKMDFHDYLDKSGIKKKVGTPVVPTTAPTSTTGLQNPTSISNTKDEPNIKGPAFSVGVGANKVVKDGLNKVANLAGDYGAVSTRRLENPKLKDAAKDLGGLVTPKEEFNPEQFLQQDITDTKTQINPEMDAGLAIADYHQKRNKEIGDKIAEKAGQLLNHVQDKVVKQGDMAKPDLFIAKGFEDELHKDEDAKKIDKQISDLHTYQSKLNQSLGHAASKVVAAKTTDPVEAGRLMRTMLGDKSAIKELDKEERGLTISDEEKFNNEKTGLDALEQAYTEQGNTEGLAKLAVHRTTLLDRHPEFKQHQLENVVAQEIVKLDKNARPDMIPLYVDELVKQGKLSKEDAKLIDYDNIPLQSELGSAMGGAYNALLGFGAGVARVGGEFIGIDKDKISELTNEGLTQGARRFEDIRQLENSPTIVDSDPNSKTYLQNIPNKDHGKYNYTFSTISHAISNGLGGLYGGFVLPMKALGGVSKALNPALTEAAAAEYGMKGTMVLSGYEHNYQEGAKIIGDAPEDEGKRHLMAMLKGILEYYAFKPMAATFSPAQTKEFGTAIKNLPQDLRNLGNTKSEALQKVITKVLEPAEKTLIESGHVGVGMTLSEFAKNIVDHALGSKEGAKESDEQLAGKVLGVWKNLPFSIAIPVGVGKFIGARHSNLTQENLYNSGLKPETYKSQLADLVDKGEITPQEATQKEEVINTMSDIVNSIPKDIDLNHNQRVKYAYAKIKEMALEAKAEGIEDAALSNFYKTKIKEEVKNREAILNGEFKTALQPESIETINDKRDEELKAVDEKIKKIADNNLYDYNKERLEKQKTEINDTYDNYIKSFNEKSKAKVDVHQPTEVESPTDKKTTEPTLPTTETESDYQKSASEIHRLRNEYNKEDKRLKDELDIKLKSANERGFKDGEFDQIYNDYNKEFGSLREKFTQDLEKHSENVGGDVFLMKGDKNAKEAHHFTDETALNEILDNNETHGYQKEDEGFGGVSLTTDSKLDDKGIVLNYGNSETKNRTSSDMPVRIDFDVTKLKEDGYKTVGGNEDLGTFPNEQELRIVKDNGEGLRNVSETTISDAKKYIKNVQVNAEILGEQKTKEVVQKLKDNNIPFTIKGEKPKSSIHVELPKPNIRPEPITIKSKEPGKVEEQSGGSGEEPPKPPKDKEENKGGGDEFHKLVHKSIESDVVKETLSNVERVTGRELTKDEKEYREIKLKDALEHGTNVVETAKKEFGKEYIPKLLEYLDNNKNTLSVDKKSLIQIAMELDLERQIQSNPDNVLTLEKQLKLVRDKSIAEQRSAARAIGYGRLRHIAEVGYDISKFTDDFFSSKEKEQKNLIEQSIQITSDQVNKTAEQKEVDKNLTEEDIHQKINEGVESEIAKLYEQLPKEKKNVVDKAIAALDKVHAKLKGKYYSDATGMVALIDAGVVTIRAALKASIHITKAVELGINKIKESYEKKFGKKWDKENEFRKDILNELKSEGVMDSENKNIERLETELERLKNRLPKEKNEAVKKKISEREQQLKDQIAAEREAIKKENAKPKEEKTVKERVSDAEENLQKRIDEIREEIINGEREVKKTKSKLQSKKLEQLREQKNALEGLRDKYLPKEIKYQDEKVVKVVENKISKEIQDLNRQIEKGVKDIYTDKKSVESENIDKLRSERDSRVEILEALDPNPKIFTQNALIEKGYGRTIKIKTKTGVEERQVVDWKKLAGEEGSIDKIKENVESVMKDKGFTPEQIDRMKASFEKEYQDLSNDIALHAVAELNKRNEKHITPEQKSAAKKLAELYNYGLFDKDPAQYDVLLAKTIGIGKLSPERFQEAHDLGKALQSMYTTDYQGKKLTDLGLRTALQSVEESMRNILHSESQQHGSTALKIADIARTYMDAVQRMALNNMKQVVENPLSGLEQVITSNLDALINPKIGTTKELKAQKRKLAASVYKDMVLHGGVGYGDVNSTFVSKGNLEMYINKMSDNQLFHAVASTAIGKSTLDAADSYFKTKLTEQKFTHNLIKILQEKRLDANGKLVDGMTKQDAINYVSEKLTGQSFEDATKTAKEIITKVNSGGKKIVGDSEHYVNRLANDIVRTALVNGQKITMEQVTAAYNSGYKAAGRSLGHEPNNFLSKMIQNYSGELEKKINDAIKDKEYKKAAFLTWQSIMFRNVLNPFVGGGTNWVVLKLEKNIGLGLISGYYNGGRTKVDLTSEAGMKHLEKAMFEQLRDRDAFMRSVVGGTTTALMSLIWFNIVDTDEYRKWRNHNKWSQKYLDIITPEEALFAMAMKNNEVGYYLENLFQKNDTYDKGKKTIKGIVNLAKGNTDKALGQFGEVAGSPFGVPVPWKLVRDNQNIWLGATGQDPITVDNKPSTSLWSGFFKAGFFEYIGVRPNEKGGSGGGGGANSKPITQPKKVKQVTQH